MNKNWNELTKEEKKFKLGAAVSVLFLISLMLPGFSLSGVKGGNTGSIAGGFLLWISGGICLGLYLKKQSELISKTTLVNLALLIIIVMYQIFNFGRISAVSGLKLEFRFGLFLSILSAILMFLASKIKPE